MVKVGCIRSGQNFKQEGSLVLDCKQGKSELNGEKHSGEMNSMRMEMRWIRGAGGWGRGAKLNRRAQERTGPQVARVRERKERQWKMT